MTAYNPSDNSTTFLAYADTVAAAADVDLTTRIDMSVFEYVEVIAAMGDGDTALAIKAQESTAASAGTLTDISGATIALAANDDQKAKVIQIRTHGREKYLSLNVTGTSGTSSVLVLIVKGYGRQYTDAYASYPLTLTQLGLS